MGKQRVSEKSQVELYRERILPAQIAAANGDLDGGEWGDDDDEEEEPEE